MISYLLIGFLALIIIVLLIKLASFRNELKRLSSDLKDMNILETNHRLNMHINSKELEGLVITVNHIMETYRKSIIDIQHHEKDIRDIITNLSHDLRTPLTSVSGYIQLLKNNNLSQEKKKEYIDIIERKTNSIKSLTDELFDFSIVESGSFKINMERVNIQSVLSDTIADFYNDISVKIPQPEINIPEKCKNILADKALLKRILINVIQNAVKYSSGYLSICLKENNSQIRIQITNDAKDFDKNDTKKIFQRFYRGESSRTTSGSGLGLNIAKTLVNHMGGEICASYQEGYLTMEIVFKTYQ